VVKNVAGYDLCKLYAGSYGTLGVLVESIFRLHPLPEDAAWVSTSLPDEDAVAHSVKALLGSQLSPVALELDRPAAGCPIELSLLFEGLRQSVEHRCESAVKVLGGSARVAARAPSWWGALPGPTTIKAMTTISGVAAGLRAVGDIGARIGLSTAVRSSPGLGVVYVGLQDSCVPVEVETLVGELRRHFLETGGSAIVLRAATQIKAALDVWGPIGAIGLMRRVKANFDPDGLLAPGRFVGGI
jgi:glycolate oxidase FAD binding subunit